MIKVITYGTYDMLHYGHLRLLERAKALGDYLIVGVTSDDYDKVLEIFVRTNTGGKKLEYSDILLSTATAKWRKLNAREEINNFTGEIEKIGNGYSFF